jgi:hypothetical protein
MNRTDFATPKFVYNFYFIHFSVGCVVIIASHSEEIISKVSKMRSKVRGFGGTSEASLSISQNVKVARLQGDP